MLDRDLQIIVNGLWAAGAEAIAINGERLTTLSAIRSAGQAILVDFRPLVPPYVVEAIGDPAHLQAGFATDMAGAYVQSLRDNYGIQVSVSSQKIVDPAGGGVARAALGAPVVTPSATDRRSSRLTVADPIGHPGTGGEPVIAVIGLVIGIIAGLVLEPTVPVWLEPYLPIAVVAALDAVFGGLRAVLDGIFDDRVFVVSFLSNVVVAGLIVYLGDQLGVGSQLSTGVVVVLGIRIFSNAAAIRRHLLKA